MQGQAFGSGLRNQATRPKVTASGGMGPGCRAYGWRTTVPACDEGLRHCRRPGSISRFIKARVGAFAQARGKTEEEAVELVRSVSGHSLRRGYGTTAARHDVPGYRIKQRMRRKSMDTTAGHIEGGPGMDKIGAQGIF